MEIQRYLQLAALERPKHSFHSDSPIPLFVDGRIDTIDCCTGVLTVLFGFARDQVCKMELWLCKLDVSF